MDRRVMIAVPKIFKKNVGAISNDAGPLMGGL